MIGNFSISSKTTWNDNSLRIGSGCYAISNGPFEPDPNNGYTISICLKVISIGGGYSGIVVQGKSTSNAMYIIGFHNSLERVYINGMEIYGNFTFGNYKDYVIDLTVAKSVATLYINGKIVASKSGTFNMSSNCKVGIGCYTNEDGMYVKCMSHAADIYAINFYDRVLTPEEIETNLNAYKTRFSLTI